MSLDGQSDARFGDQASGLEVCTFAMPAGTVFDWHVHEDHQLAWASSGVLTVRSGDEAWVLPPNRALWIPAGVRHETLSDGAATMRSAYVQPASCSIEWTTCTPVNVSPLVAELLGHLERNDLDPSARSHAEYLLVELLEPVATLSFEVRMPTDDRALRVAEMLIENPADDRTLTTWGVDVGASSRTLARAFIAETGLPFARWRALVRLQRAMAALGSDEPVTEVARQVGYESASAFVAAFRRETGITPARYFHNEQR
ncbi:MAG TPA: helix-turn-helix transcriptional regulator [Acidimicrobiales bacterium]